MSHDEGKCTGSIQGDNDLLFIISFKVDRTSWEDHRNMNVRESKEKAPEHGNGRGTWGFIRIPTKIYTKIKYKKSWAL